MERGKFIVLEGADGAGTTTMARQLMDLIEASGAPVIRTHEPSTGKVGTLIRSLLETHTEPLTWRMMCYLFMADRIDHVESVIEPALKEGKHVICDRYYPSTLVYQSISTEDNAFPVTMEYLYKEMQGIYMYSGIDPAWLEPDLCLYIGVPFLDTLRERRADRGRQDMYEGDRTQEKVLGAYDHWFTCFPGNNMHVDGVQPLEAVRRECWGYVCALLKICKTGREEALRRVSLK